MSDHILITCPVTSTPVRTGFRAPPGTRIADLKRVTLHFCPACGKSHPWEGHQGFWDETPEAPGTLWDDVRRIWRSPRRY